MSNHADKAARRAALIDALAARFPKCITVHQARRRPLKLHIDEDIVALFDVDRRELSYALSTYVNNLDYLRHCKAGAPRFNLNGDAAGEVTAEEAAHAREKFERLKARQKNQRLVRERAREQERAAIAAAAPKRLSLADLKAAAQRRKAGAL